MGFKVTNSGQVMCDGIDLGNNKALQVASGTNPTDAVNFSQLIIPEIPPIFLGTKLVTVDRLDYNFPVSGGPFTNSQVLDIDLADVNHSEAKFLNAWAYSAANGADGSASSYIRFKDVSSNVLFFLQVGAIATGETSIEAWAHANSYFIPIPSNARFLQIQLDVTTNWAYNTSSNIVVEYFK